MLIILVNTDIVGNTGIVSNTILKAMQLLIGM